MVEQHRTSSQGAHSVATAALLIGAIALLAFVPACSTSSTPAAVSTTSSSSSTTSTTSSVTLPEQDPAELATCVSDAQTLAEVLDAYMAEHGAYPSPPAAWSAATYAANYQPLTAASDGGPFLPSPPGRGSTSLSTTRPATCGSRPPGAYGPYNKGQDFALQPDICDAAVG